jgi:hypothetical protein
MRKTLHLTAAARQCNLLRMSELLDDLLISDVVSISGAKLETLRKWIDAGFVTAPPIVGKHRRFSAQHTIEVILMVALMQRGMRPSVAGPMAVRAAGTVFFHYIYDWAEQRGVEIVMTLPWSLMVDLRSGLSTIGRSDAFSDLAYRGDWLKIDLAPVIGGALTRALAVAKARNV